MLNQLLSAKYLLKVACYTSEQKNYVVEERKEVKEYNKIVITVLCVC